MNFGDMDSDMASSFWWVYLLLFFAGLYCMYQSIGLMRKGFNIFRTGEVVVRIIKWGTSETRTGFSAYFIGFFALIPIFAISIGTLTFLVILFCQPAALFGSPPDSPLGFFFMALVIVASMPAIIGWPALILFWWITGGLEF